MWRAYTSRARSPAGIGGTTSPGFLRAISMFSRPASSGRFSAGTCGLVVPMVWMKRLTCSPNTSYCAFASPAV